MAIVKNTQSDIYIASTNIVSPLGLTTLKNFEQVIKGESGLSYQQFDFTDKIYPVGKIDEKEIDHAFLPYQKEGKSYSKLEKMSILSVHQALESCTFSPQDKDVLFLFCSTKGNVDVLAQGDTNGMKNQVSLFETAKRIASHFGFAHPPLVVSSACISGSLGIVMANRLLRQGSYKHVVVAAVDGVTDFTLSGFNAFQAIDTEPCKPYDANRKGINLGEAAATMVLSQTTELPADSIQVAGGAVSNDATHISAPSRTGEGLYLCIQKVLEGQQETIDFICGHGTATNYNDAMESWAFQRAGIANIPVHSLKGYYGHTLGTSGLLESILAVESLRQNQMIPSKNFSELGVPHPINPIQEAKEIPLQSCLKTSSGFGGCNVAVLFRKLNTLKKKAS